jgi:hypothetical protein
LPPALPEGFELKGEKVRAILERYSKNASLAARDTPTKRIVMNFARGLTDESVVSDTID